MDERQMVDTRLGSLAVRVRGEGPVAVLWHSNVLLSPTTQAQDPEADVLVLDCWRSMNRAGLINAVVSISLRRPDLTSRLAQIQCPTLFVTGSDHAGWTPEQAERANARRCATEVIPNAAYLIPFEATDRTIKLVRDFWARHLPDAISDREPARRDGADRLILRSDNSTGLPGQIIHNELVAALTLNDVAAHGYAGSMLSPGEAVGR
jgi:hypothetical protein